jgi:uncharacterized protein (TIGR03437 family)
MEWCRGRGDGSFALEEVFGGLAPENLMAGDFDGDGVTDAVAGSAVLNSITVLTHVSKPPLAVVASIVKSGMVAPGTLASAYGSGFTARAESAPSGSSAFALGGISVEITDAAGSRSLAPLFSVSPAQIDFQIPSAAVSGNATLRIRGNDGSLSEPVDFRIAPSAPAMFITDFGERLGFWYSVLGYLPPAATAVRIEADGGQTVLPIYSCEDRSAVYTCLLSPIALAGRPVYLTLYGTGIRGRSSLDAVRCQIGDVSLPVEYAGPAGAGMAGLDQVNVRLTPAVSAHNNPQFLTLIVDGQATNSGSILID